MSPGLLIAALACGALVLVAGAGVASRARWTRRLAALAVVPALAGLALVAFVLGEDPYRDNGTSRWDAYRSPGGDLGEVFVGSVLAAAIAAVLIAYGAVRRQPQFTRAALLAAAAVVLVLIRVTIQFSAN